MPPTTLIRGEVGGGGGGVVGGEIGEGGGGDLISPFYKG